MSEANNLKHIYRFAPWMSVFPYQSHSVIRLHEIAWIRMDPGNTLDAPFLDRLLLSCILGGEGQMLQNGQTYRFSSGQVIIFDMREAFLTTAGPSGLDFVSIQMSSVFTETLYSYILAEKGPLLSGGSEILALIEDIYSFACGKWSARADIEISAALYRLLGLLLTQSTSQRETDTALLYIQQHYMDELPLEELAQSCGMSLYHFIRRFKRDTGLTPHSYIRGYRVQKAKELLIQTNLPISAIANFVGYGDASHFSALFRSSTGCLPREYRKLYGK